MIFTSRLFFAKPNTYPTWLSSHQLMMGSRLKHRLHAAQSPPAAIARGSGPQSASPHPAPPLTHRCWNSAAAHTAPTPHTRCTEVNSNIPDNSRERIVPLDSRVPDHRWHPDPARCARAVARTTPGTTLSATDPWHRSHGRSSCSALGHRRLPASTPAG